MVKTSFTELLNLKTPICVPPMAGAAGGELASAVSNAGGLGFVASGYESFDQFKKELEIVKQKTTQTNGVWPIGVGFIAWTLDKHGPEKLEYALDFGAAAIWLSFGNDLFKYIDIIRARKSLQPKIFVLVYSAEQAQAMTEQKVDVLIAQGIESGGHGYEEAIPLTTLITAILRAIPDDGPIVLAAGGLALGSQVAAALTAGAAGVVMGTRFLTTPEALYNDAQKKALIEATAFDTVRTMAFDEARGTTSWPAGVDGRGIRNALVTDFLGGMTPEKLRVSFDAAAKAKDPTRMVVWAGMGVGFVNEIKPAGEIIKEVDAELIKTLQRAQQLL